MITFLSFNDWRGQHSVWRTEEKSHSITKQWPILSFIFLGKSIEMRHFGLISAHSGRLLKLWRGLSMQMTLFFVTLAFLPSIFFFELLLSSLMSNKLIGLRTSGRCESISCFFFFLLKLFRKLPWLAAAVTSFLSSSHLTKESGKCNLRDLQ